MQIHPIYHLKKSCDLSALVHIDSKRRRLFRKSRHCHDRTCQHDHKTCTCGYIGFPDCDIEVLWSAQKRRVIGKGILRLCHTYRQIPEAKLRQLCKLLLCCGCIVYTLCAVDLFCNRFDLFCQWQFAWIQRCKMTFFLFQCL